jgi:hypothetical protein
VALGHLSNDGEADPCARIVLLAVQALEDAEDPVAVRIDQVRDLFGAKDPPVGTRSVRT